MKLTTWLPIAALALLAPLAAQKPGDPYLGRWDMTITATDLTYPGWLEVTVQNGKMAARVQPRTGSVHPATDVVEMAMVSGPNVASSLSLTVSQATPQHPALTWNLSLKDGKLTGTQHYGDTVNFVTGVRAPALDRPAPQAWANPEPLFDGKDLAGWQPDNPAANHWVARNGELVNQSKGANLRTRARSTISSCTSNTTARRAATAASTCAGATRFRWSMSRWAPTTRSTSMGAIYGIPGAHGEFQEARPVGELRRDVGRPACDRGSQRREDHRQPGDPRHHRRRDRRREGEPEPSTSRAITPAA